MVIGLNPDRIPDQYLGMACNICEPGLIALSLLRLIARSPVTDGRLTHRGSKAFRI